MIKKIDGLMKGFEIEKRDHIKFQKNKLEAYKEKDIISIHNAPIVAEVREFKEKIEDTRRRLKDLEALIQELNTMLIMQDMANATNLLAKKAKNLRDRLVIAQGELKKIATCGEEMDGNCSHNEEEEFIDALKDEMPEVFKNIEGNFAQLDKIDDLIKEVKDSKSIDTMQVLKNEVDDANTKVEQCEGLVNKLENEIIEWDALKKLCRRDEELGEIENLLGEFNKDLNEEKNSMDKHMEKQQGILAKDPSDNDSAYRIEGINIYVADNDKLWKDVNYLKEEKDECFEEFDEDVPSPVKEVRNKRMSNTSPQKGKKGGFQPGPTASDKPTDMYYMMNINSKYRQRIHDMLKTLRSINQARRELEEKYAQLKLDLNKEKKGAKMYIAVKGDAIDELWAYHLNLAQLDLPVIRMGVGKYLFGTRNIMAKIINGRLVVRVGGGYMSADEFIAQYGKVEIAKMLHNEEVREQNILAAAKMESEGS